MFNTVLGIVHFTLKSKKKRNVQERESAKGYLSDKYSLLQAP